MSVYHVPQDPDAVALANHDEYGLTWPQEIEYELTAKMMGDEWVPVITSMTGRYSRQATLLTGLNGVPQQDIPDASVATAGNYELMLEALENLGTPANQFTHYSLAAVQAHEDQHANRVRLALENKKPEIEALFEAITVPVAGNGDEAAAVVSIKADPRYAQAKADAFDLWDREFDALIAGDHTGDGPCEMAEKRVTRGLAEAIRQKAIDQRWLATPDQVEGTGVQPGQVGNIIRNWPPQN
jgi:hypothetical protein